MCDLTVIKQCKQYCWNKKLRKSLSELYKGGHCPFTYAVPPVLLHTYLFLFCRLPSGWGPGQACLLSLFGVFYTFGSSISICVWHPWWWAPSGWGIHSYRLASINRIFISFVNAAIGQNVYIFSRELVVEPSRLFSAILLVLPSAGIFNFVSCRCRPTCCYLCRYWPVYSLFCPATVIRLVIIFGHCYAFM